MITILHEQRETRLPDAIAEGDDLWLDRPAIEQATGWTWKPEGLCQGDLCVPLPRGAGGEVVRDGRLDLAAMWRRSGQPVVHDVASDSWAMWRQAAEKDKRGLASGPAFWARVDALGDRYYYAPVDIASG